MRPQLPARPPIRLRGPPHPPRWLAPRIGYLGRFVPVTRVGIRLAGAKALQLDRSLAEAHSWLGTVPWWYDRDDTAARREFHTAITMQPDLAAAHEMYGWYLVAAGQIDAGLAESRRAVELDPLSSEINAFLGVNLYLTRRYDEAVKQLRAAIHTDSSGSARPGA